MGKALLGTHTSPATLRLLDEVRALRARVDELERALAEAEALRETRSGEAGPVGVRLIEDREPART